MQPQGKYYPTHSKHATEQLIKDNVDAIINTKQIDKIYHYEVERAETKINNYYYRKNLDQSFYDILLPSRTQE